MLRRLACLFVLALPSCQFVLGLDETSSEAAPPFGSGGSTSGGRTSYGGVPSANGASGAKSATSEDWPRPLAERVFRVTHPWPGIVRNICYRFQSGVDDAQQAELTRTAGHFREIVESSWGFYADLSLLGWAECEARVSGIVVELSVADTSSSELGYPGQGLTRVVTVNRDASDAEMLYVFGRALGFEHEFGRAPYGGTCRHCTSDDDCDEARPSCLPSGSCGNLADHESIMAAPDCGGIEPIREFSVWDALGAQQAYGRHHAGSFVDSGGRCLNVSGGQPTAGASIISWPCHGGLDNNTWERVFVGGSQHDFLVRATMGGVERCLELVGEAESGWLIAQACDPDDARQRFRQSRVRIRSMAARCVAATGDTEGATLEQAECGNSAWERWSFGRDQIALSGSDLCVTVPGGAAVDGALLDLRPCGSSPELQAFSYLRDEIHYVDPQGVGKAFDVHNGAPTTGSIIDLWWGATLGFPNLAFNVSGPLEIEGGCVEALEVPLDMPSSAVTVAPCNDGPRQQWDYYW